MLKGMNIENNGNNCIAIICEEDNDVINNKILKWSDDRWGWADAASCGMH
jgi:hypothetical protein